MATLNTADLNRQGKVFVAANVSAKSVIAVTTAMTGVLLYNPAGSNKKLIIIDGGFVWTTAPGAVHNIGWALATPVQVGQGGPTSLTAIGSGVLAADGSGAANNAVARAYDAATIVTAGVPVRWFMGATWGSSVGVSPYTSRDEVEGALVVVPGAAVMFTVVTTTAVGMGSMTWAEVPQ